MENSEFLPTKYDGNSERISVDVWKKCLENFGAIAYPDATNAARQAKLRLIMLSQTTGKAREYVFESIADNVLWNDSCAALKARFEGEQIQHDASEKIAKGLVRMYKVEKIRDFESRWGKVLSNAGLAFNDSQKLLFFRSALRPRIAGDVADVAAETVDSLCKTIETRQVTGMYGPFWKDCKPDASEHFAYAKAKANGSEPFFEGKRHPTVKKEFSRSGNPRFSGTCHWCAKVGHKEVEYSSDRWHPWPALLDSRADLSFILEEAAQEAGLKSTSCYQHANWGKRLTIKKCYRVLIAGANGEEVPITCFAVDGEVGLLDKEEPLLIGESDFERLGWRLKQEPNLRIIKEHAKEEVFRPPETVVDDKEFWIRDLWQDTTPPENELPTGLAALQPSPDIVVGVDWPEELKTIVEKMPRAVTSMDLKEPAKFEPVEFEFRSDLPEELPPRYTPKVHPFVEETTEARLQELIDAGIYEEGVSPYGSPWLTVPKPNKPGEYRDCIDNRGINEFIIMPSLPLSRAEDFIAGMVGMKKAFALDLTKAFFQIPIGPETGRRCAVVTTKRQAIPKRLPMGAKPSSSYMEYLITRYIIQPIKWRLNTSGIALNIFRDNIVGGALDDARFVLLFSALVEKLIEFNVRIGDAEIYKDSIKCLGFNIHLQNQTAIEPLATNIEKIKQFGTLQSQKDVRKLLGMTNFYRSFVPNYAKLTAPLEEKLKLKPKAGDIQNDNELQQNALKLRHAVTNYSLLAAYDSNLPVELFVDASETAAGAVLIQRFQKGHASVVSYWSKKFSDSQQKYNTTRREALALLWAVKMFRHMFHPGAPTRVYVDHRPLETFLKSGGVAGDNLLQRWSLLLQEEYIEIIWLPGDANPADQPSRDKILAVQSSADIEENVRRYLASQLSSGGEQVDDDQFDSVTRRWARRYKLIDVVLWKDDYPVLPREQRLPYITEQHESLSHCPKTVLTEIIKDRYRWEGLEADVAAVVESCVDCQRGRIHQGSSPIPEEMVVTNRSNWNIFDEISIDFMVELPDTPRKAKNLLVIVEAVSGWVEAYPTRNKSAVEVAGCLWDYFCRFCIPRRIRCDRGGEFINETIAQMADLLKFELKTTSRYRPSSNGQVERRNAVIWDRLSRVAGDNSDWDLDIRNVTMAMNTSTLARLGMSAYELLFQIPPRLPLDLRWKIAQDDVPVFQFNPEGCRRFISQRSAEHGKLWERAKKALRQYEQRSRHGREKFSRGDLVMIPNVGRKKKEKKRLGPFVVVEVRPRSLKVALADGTHVVVEISGCRRYIPSLTFGRGAVPSELTGIHSSVAGGESVRNHTFTHDAAEDDAELVDEQ